jgi:hypothetical protein
MQVHNPMCDGEHCASPEGEVRLLPTSDQSNAILCKTCFAHELGWRRGRNVNLYGEAKFALPAWEELEVYGGAT